MKINVSDEVIITKIHKDIKDWEIIVPNPNPATKTYIRDFMYYCIRSLPDILQRNMKLSNRKLRKYMRKLLDRKNGTSFHIYDSTDKTPHSLALCININTAVGTELDFELNMNTISFEAEYSKENGSHIFHDSSDIWYKVEYKSILIHHESPWSSIRKALPYFSKSMYWNKDLLEARDSKYIYMK